MSQGYKSGAPAALTDAERALLPEDRRYADYRRFHPDPFVNREMYFDRVEEMRAEAQAAAEFGTVQRIERLGLMGGV